jgi:DNA-binding response OmpR family regulator
MDALLLATDVDEAVVLARVLRHAGLGVSYASDLERAMRTWSDQPAEAILLALSAPSPLEQVRYVRSQAVLPILIMIIDPTDKQALHVALLNEGADLVVTRPYSTRLLTCQVQTLFRRIVSPPPPRRPAEVLL